MEHAIPGQVDQGHESVSTDEANEILRIWAERQRASAKTVGQPTVHDIAEALNIPPAEVRQILAQVRQPQVPVPQIMPSERRARKVLVGLLIAFLCMGALGMISSAYYESRSSARAAPVASATVADSVAIASPSLEDWPFQAQIGEFTYVGTSQNEIPVSGSRMDQEQRLASSVMRRIEEIWSPKSYPEMKTRYSISEITMNLRKSAPTIGVEFVKVSLSTSRGVSDVTIPVARSSESKTVQAVRAEQLRTLRLLANKALLLVDPNSPPAARDR